MKSRFVATGGRLRPFSIGAWVFCAALLSAIAAHAETPVKLAVFDFELDDFSAGGPLAGESPTETARLKLVTSEARRLIAQSGRYSLVDTSGADGEAVQTHWLRNCNGCDADIALKLGAEQSFLGTVQKLSTLVHTVRFQIRDARTGAVIRNVQTDLRGDTDESWTRAVAWLVKHRLLDGGAAQQ